MVNDAYYSADCDILNTYEYKTLGADDSTYITLEPSSSSLLTYADFYVTNSPSFVSYIFERVTYTGLKI